MRKLKQMWIKIQEQYHLELTLAFVLIMVLVMLKAIDLLSRV